MNSKQLSLFTISGNIKTRTEHEVNGDSILECKIWVKT